MFAIVPNEVILDHSLTLIETRVLIGLYSYRDPKSTRPVWPGRVALSKRCGYHPDVISRTTSSLQSKGWIRKIRRGKKRTNTYEILGKSDLTDPVRSDATEPVRSIGTDQLTDQYLSSPTRPQGKHYGRKLSVVEQAAAATARVEARLAAEAAADPGDNALLAADGADIRPSISQRVGIVRKR